jgi:CubicO group peptidase (beta-lactamase class C family)
MMKPRERVTAATTWNPTPDPAKSRLRSSRILRTLFSTLALAALVVVPVGAQSISEDPAVREAIDVARIWLDAQHDFEQVPGIAVALVHDQELVWSEGIGVADKEDGRLNASNTLYSICSISKLFTSVALMQLRDQGLVTLRDPVSKHLPWFTLQQVFEESPPITVEGILTHSAGLPRESAHPYWTGPEYPFPTKDEIITKVSGQETWFAPHTKYQYSNLGLSLAGYIVEEASGVPYHDYIRQNILDPLGMHDTYSEMPEQHIGGQLATGYSGFTRDGVRVEEPFFQARGIAPAAGFASTVDDLAKFAMWQFRNRGNDSEILSGLTLSEMQRAHFIDPDTDGKRGLGFGVSKRDGKTWVGHGGSCPGFQTTLSMQNDEKIATIAFINARESPNKYAVGIYQLVGPAIRDAAKAGSAATDTDDMGGSGDLGGYAGQANSELDDYVGRYVRGVGASETAVFRWKGGIAMMSLPTDQPLRSLSKLQHVEGDTFRRLDDDGEPGREIIFERDAEGRIIRMWNPLNFQNRVN